MPTNPEFDRYASELIQRFEELTKWAIANWPKKTFPLLPSDFNQSRREIGSIIGPKLGECEAADVAPTINAKSAQYQDVNPMPWP